MDREKILQLFDVSRETAARLDVYVELLEQWQRKINLVSAKTLASVWERHIADGLHAFTKLPNGAVADFGTGGGVPGLIFVLLGHEEVQIVESDTRKVMFLRTVLRDLGLTATFHNQRVEKVPALDVPIITGRAFAPLSKFLSLAVPHLSSGGTLLIHKGKNYASEIEDAKQHFDFNLDIESPPHGGEGVLVRLHDIHKR